MSAAQAGTPISRVDLHLHSRASADTGNWVLRQAVLPESFTEPLEGVVTSTLTKASGRWAISRAPAGHLRVGPPREQRPETSSCCTASPTSLRAARANVNARTSRRPTSGIGLSSDGRCFMASALRRAALSRRATTIPARHISRVRDPRSRGGRPATGSIAKVAACCSRALVWVHRQRSNGRRPRRSPAWRPRSLPRHGACVLTCTRPISITAASWRPPWTSSTACSTKDES